MKKLILLLFCAALLGPQVTFAQCTPNPGITQPGIYPDSLPSATAGTPYSETLQVRVPADTNYLGQTVPIVSVAITGISGLPPGFTYQCVPNNCVFPGGSNGCVVFSGNPTLSDVGTYPVSIILTTTVTFFGFPVSQTDTLTGYTFFVNAPVSVYNIKGTKLEVKQNYPNPSINKTTIEFFVPNTTTAEFKFFNVLGKELLSRKYNARQGKNIIELDTRDFEDGIYMYTVKTGNSVQTRRMVISKKQ